jgi:bifunctional DNA-binding transcriptional regulator/antitoxin component of YhaV-PrlF toxin-antitoxin module
VFDKIKPKDCPDSISFIALSDERGRILIPAFIRRRLKIKSRSLLLITVRTIKKRIKYKKEK